jgi:hypothetical protein
MATASPTSTTLFMAISIADRLSTRSSAWHQRGRSSSLALGRAVWPSLWRDAASRLTAEQVSCFKAVARHLADGGAFVVEAFVPDAARFDRRQGVRASEIAMDKVIIDVTHHDPVSQTVISQHVLITEQGIRLLPVLARYAYPPELDLMARLAGLQLEERWGDWDRSPFSTGSDKHVSVYRPITQ